MTLIIFSFQNAFRRKPVALLAIFGVAFGTALVTFLFSLVGGMDNRVERTFGEVSNKIVVSGRDAIFGGLFLGIGTTPVPSSYVEAIRNVSHAERVYSQVSAVMRPVNVNFAMPLFGFKAGEVTDFDNVPQNRIIEGVAPANDREAIMGKSIREYMKLLDSPLEIGNTYQFIIMEGGRAKILELKITGVYQTDNEVLDGAFSGSENLAREMSRIAAGNVSAINVTVDGVNNVESAATAIQKELSGKKPEVQVVAPTGVLTPVKKILNILSGFLLAVSLVAVIAGGMSVMVVMLLSVVSRKREFGIMKALGWTPANIIYLVMIESLILSISGTTLGLALGYGGMVAARTLIVEDIAVLTWQMGAGICLAGICTGLAGGIYPAWHANSAAPARILRELF